MIIYEVNLRINKEIYPQFRSWLRIHVIELLQFPGFIQARILKEEITKESNQEILTVQYQLSNRGALEAYFTEFAPRMREEGLRLFKNKFSVERKIFEVQENILKS